MHVDVEAEGVVAVKDVAAALASALYREGVRRLVRVVHVHRGEGLEVLNRGVRMFVRPEGCQEGTYGKLHVDRAREAVGDAEAFFRDVGIDVRRLMIDRGTVANLDPGSRGGCQCFGGMLAVSRLSLHDDIALVQLEERRESIDRRPARTSRVGAGQLNVLTLSRVGDIHFKDLRPSSFECVEYFMSVEDSGPASRLRLCNILERDEPVCLLGVEDSADGPRLSHFFERHILRKSSLVCSA